MFSCSSFSSFLDSSEPPAFFSTLRWPEEPAEPERSERLERVAVRLELLVALLCERKQKQNETRRGGGGQGHEKNNEVRENGKKRLEKRKNKIIGKRERIFHTSVFFF